MEFNQFLGALKAALTERGIDNDAATRHVTALARTFTPDDIQEIRQYRSPEDFTELSDHLAAAIKKRASSHAVASPVSKATAVSPPHKPVAATAAQVPVQAPDSRHTPLRTQAEPSRSAQTAPPRALPLRTHTDIPVRRAAAPVRNPEPDDMEVMELGEHGKKIFWTIFGCSLPLTLLAAVLYFGVYGLLYGGIVLAILGCIAALILLVAGGSAVSLAGIIYGVIRLFSIPSEGLYEIGLGITIIGIVTLFSILLYNLALRLIPLLFKQVGRLFRFTTEQLKKLILHWRKECYKL